MKRIPTFLLTLFAAVTMNAQTDTTYPGDANYDGYCNHEDVLVIGLKFGVSGPQRDSLGDSWFPFPSYSWGDSMYNNVTTNHADCNGDGVINQNDLTAIDHNFGLTHDTTLAATNAFAFVGATSQDPHLSFTTRGQVDSVFVSDTVILDVELGTQGMVANLTGMSFTAMFTSTLVDTIIVNFDSSQLLPATARLDFDETDYVHGQTRLSSVLSNQTTVSVAGKVATLIIVMEGNIAGKTDILQDTLIICPEHIIAIDTLGNVTPIFGVCDSMIVYDLDNGGPGPSPKPDFRLYPNPSDGSFIISSKQNPMEEIVITNTVGQVVAHETTTGGREEIIFNVSLPSGLYLLTARSGSKVTSHKLQIINP